MSYTQKTLIKNVKPIDVVRCFHSYKFIQFLTLGQPVKIKVGLVLITIKKQHSHFGSLDGGKCQLFMKITVLVKRIYPLMIKD